MPFGFSSSTVSPLIPYIWSLKPQLNRGCSTLPLLGMATYAHHWPCYNRMTPFSSLVRMDDLLKDCPNFLDFVYKSELTFLISCSPETPIQRYCILQAHSSNFILTEAKRTWKAKARSLWRLGSLGERRRRFRALEFKLGLFPQYI